MILKKFTRQPRGVDYAFHTQYKALQNSCCSQLSGQWVSVKEIIQKNVHPHCTIVSHRLTRPCILAFHSD